VHTLQSCTINHNRITKNLYLNVNIHVTFKVATMVNDYSLSIVKINAVLFLHASL
jgi:hypothetical protein